MATWTQATRTSFFREVEQIGLTVAQRNSLAVAGIVQPLDCVQLCTKADWKDVGDSARRANIANGTLTVIQLKRLLYSALAMNYFGSVGRAVLPPCIHFTNHIVRFMAQLDALKEKAKNANTEITKCTKSMPIMKWIKHVVEDLN